MNNRANGITHRSFDYLINDSLKHVHVIQYEQTSNPDLTLLISKASEALVPDTVMNHIGDGGTMNEIVKAQKGVRFIINAGFSHYRKDFYQWQHQNFNVGDPVGIVKIRDHHFEDFINLKHYGFLTQESKGSLWKITDQATLNSKSKYILGCTPLLISESQPVTIPLEDMQPLEHSSVNPPSFLGHGLQSHPRTAVGMKGNDIYFIVVENNSTDTGGCTLLELQSLGLSLELDSLLNLDGGGSSQFKLLSETDILSNYILPEDEKRVLGHVLIIFDESLK